MKNTMISNKELEALQEIFKGVDKLVGVAQDDHRLIFAIGQCGQKGNARLGQLFDESEQSDQGDGMGR